MGELPEQSLEGTLGLITEATGKWEAVQPQGTFKSKCPLSKAPSGGNWGAGLEVSRKGKRQDEELAGD